MATVVKGFSISVIDAYIVNIEIDTLYGKPSVSIVGMGDTAIKESRERLEAAIISNLMSGKAFPFGRTVNSQ